MLLSALFAYEHAPEMVRASLFVANKLAYFLRRLGDRLILNFRALLRPARPGRS